MNNPILGDLISFLFRFSLIWYSILTISIIMTALQAKSLISCKCRKNTSVNKPRKDLCHLALKYSKLYAILLTKLQKENASNAGHVRKERNWNQSWNFFHFLLWFSFALFFAVFSDLQSVAPKSRIKPQNDSINPTLPKAVTKTVQ